MINIGLIRPEYIAVIGASENTAKPGGKVVENLIQANYKGEIYAVNPKKINVKGVKWYEKVSELPETDLAILSIPAELCIEAVEILLKAGTRAFIIYSAGFGESDELGKNREGRLLDLIHEYHASLIGPNCIGVINEHYKGVFTTPVPKFYQDGCELISSSGATAVFIMEAAQETGLRFSNVYSIGNASATGVEELLEHMDITFEKGKSPTTKLLYLENIKHPFKFLKHASSLIRKGCRIAAIKSGSSEAGSRAASSHTGAMATSDILIRALFKKAGIVYCSGREELISVGCVWQNKVLEGENIAVITHAGGSAVMLTDALSSNGMKVPPISEDKGADLLKKLYPGSSVANPIDFLATGTAEQLGEIIDFCEQLDEIDGMVVVFGSPGLFNVQSAYDILDKKMQSCKKPIYPVLPSLINAKNEIENFLQKGNTNFSDEVVLGNALTRSFLCPKPTFGIEELASMDFVRIRGIISEAKSGYLDAENTRELMISAGLDVVNQQVCYKEAELKEVFDNIPFPIAMKVMGPVHKTDVGGVSLNINNQEVALSEFNRMMQIKGAKGILIQEMTVGEELYCGAVKRDNYGHLVMCGLGGIFIEVIRDTSYGLAPLNQVEAKEMIRTLKGYPIIQGYRQRKGVNEDLFRDAIVRIASLVYMIPEISELDINPFIGNEKRLVAVDARVNIVK
jgi:acetate---CoA ligase (ADP-forming)